MRWLGDPPHPYQILVEPSTIAHSSSIARGKAWRVLFRSREQHVISNTHPLNRTKGICVRSVCFVQILRDRPKVRGKAQAKACLPALQSLPNHPKVILWVYISCMELVSSPVYSNTKLKGSQVLALRLNCRWRLLGRGSRVGEDQ